MLINRGSRISRSMPTKKMKMYCGPILSQMIPEKRAKTALVTILKNRVMPIHLPICSGGTISLSMAPPIGPPMK